MNYVAAIIEATWTLLEQSAPYILIGLLVGGLLKIFLSPDYVATHLGSGKIKSVLKAALLGIPLPLCSCGVLPAAAQLKKQGANNGATTAFLIATPESGVDSIAVSWVLLDPLMTVARPLAAFLSACIAGVLENVFFWQVGQPEPLSPLPMTAAPVTACTSVACGCRVEQIATNPFKDIKHGLYAAVADIWDDLAGWFFVGIVIAAGVTVFVPDDWMFRHLGGGLGAMLLMVAAGIPLYICATASTPIAAALILKGVSPGTALVFLLVGPATNITALAVLVRILGKKGVALYLASIAVVSVLCGLALDGLYFSLGMSAAATIGVVAETLPHWAMLTSTAILLVLSLPVLGRWGSRMVHRD